MCRLDLDNGNDYRNIGYELINFIVALNVLEHIKDDLFALRELYRMLKKNGMLLDRLPSRSWPIL